MCELVLCDIDLLQDFGVQDVCICIYIVGICGSDLYYYIYGCIGFFKVEVFMVLGYEVLGIIIEVGSDVM